MVGMFPSPYGVIFILTLILITKGILKHLLKKFPSPYGVIFILTFEFLVDDTFRESNLFPSPYGVIFILTKNYQMYIS